MAQCQAFEVSSASCRDAANAKTTSLQDAFEKYRTKRKKYLQGAATLTRTKEEKDALRQHFVEAVKSYIGIPYAQKYHEQGSALHNAKLFLDCCGLVRHVLKDLTAEFGFLIGPWNQAYMFDTLPIVLFEASEMRAGDLVFVSGTYINPKVKKQCHDIVHVEVWAGNGEKTIGARWHHGCVEVHNSYKFIAKTYHDMHYHFRSIDTWLSGQCKSICPSHHWNPSTFIPGKYSIFTDSGEAAYTQQQQQHHHVEHHMDECVHVEQHVDECVHVKQHVDECVHVEQQFEECCLRKDQQREEDMVCTKPAIKTATSFTGGSIIEPRRHFTICGYNGRSLVKQHLLSKGWVQSESKVNYALKWTELKCHINYNAFCEGEQLVNHFSNINLLTTKIGLLESLRSYYRLNQPRLPMANFFPETFRMDMIRERERFFHLYDGKTPWICKPTGANQGKGIFLVRGPQQLRSRLEKDERACKASSKPTARIVQRYIRNPLLLQGRKFDLRVYMLVVWGKQWLVFMREGYARLCCDRYDQTSSDLSVHLTNQYQQKKNPAYSTVKEDTIWDFAKVHQYVQEEYGLPHNWLHSTLMKKIAVIMVICFKSVKHRLNKAVGCFELLGFDFMLDETFNVWLIEVNFNPALMTNCETLAQLVPHVVQETLDIAIEVFDKCHRHLMVHPIKSLNQFKKLSI